MKICLATNWDDGLLEGASELGKEFGGKIYEVFGSYQSNIVGSGRPSLILPEVTPGAAKDHVNLAHSLGMEFNYLINASCMENKEFYPKYHLQILEYIDEIVNLGADSVTVAMPFLVEVVKEQYPDLGVTLSSYCLIDSVRKARFFEGLGADRLILSNSIRRNFHLIKDIRRAVNCGIEILVNNACLFQCPYEITHSNTSSHGSQVDNEGYGGHYTQYSLFKCNLAKLLDLSEILKSPWVRPEDVTRYEGLGIKFFKIEGRNMPTKWLLNNAEAYLSRKYERNIFELLGESILGYFQHSPLNTEPLPPLEINIDNQALDGFLDFFWEGKCTGDCTRCSHCEKWTEKVLRIDTEIKEKYIESAKKLLRQMTRSEFMKDFKVKEEEWRESVPRHITEVR
jgi:hypothetical protein